MYYIGKYDKIIVNKMTNYGYDIKTAKRDKNINKELEIWQIKKLHLYKVL